MIKKNIKTEKTARYYLSEQPSSKTKHVWVVCHGYAMLAESFIKQFSVLNNEENIVIAPEALNRFYWDGFYGKVVASWMTKDDREDDIYDNIQYLENVLNSVFETSKLNREVRTHLIGFSQGTSTAVRWLNKSEYQFSSFTLWAGAFASEVDISEKNPKLVNCKLALVLGKQDPFVNEERKKKMLEFLDSSGLEYKFIEFEGKHEINEKALVEMRDYLIKT